MTREPVAVELVNLATGEVFEQPMLFDLSDKKHRDRLNSWCLENGCRVLLSGGLQRLFNAPPTGAAYPYAEWVSPEANKNYGDSPSCRESYFIRKRGAL